MKVLLSILLFYTSALFGFTLKDKFIHAQPGVYIVTEQSKNISILFVRALSHESIVLEEISFPEKAIDLSTIHWQEWLNAKAPGHTSWISYEIDLKTNHLQESFSYTHNGWLFLQDSDYLLAKLLTLSLEKVHDIDRRRIGPAPKDGENDTRALWNPSFKIAGKKIAKPKSEVWHGKWPEDKTLLAGCGIELYFDAERPHFPFPYWIEIQSSHYSLKIRTIDSGDGLVSPMPLLPHKPPTFLGMPKKNHESLQFLIRTPPYFQKLKLYAIDLSLNDSSLIPIPSSRKSSSKTEEIVLEAEQKDLRKILIRGHLYRFIVIAEEGHEGYAELHQPFLWNE